MPEEMKPGPAVELERRVSDRSEHQPMLENQAANALADEAAIKQARLLGLTEIEIDRYLRGPELPIPTPQDFAVEAVRLKSMSPQSIGNICERIVANELEYHGFAVRDLNLGGIAANVDLLAVKDGRVWQIQVKGARFDTNYKDGWWFHYGYCRPEHISNHQSRMFNRSVGSFRADIVVLTCIKSPREYQCIVLPVEKAEEAAQINLGYAYRTKKPDGADKKPGVVWMAFYIPHTSDEKKREMQREIELLKDYREKWDFDKTVSPSFFLNTTSEAPEATR